LVWGEASLRLSELVENENCGWEWMASTTRKMEMMKCPSEAVIGDIFYDQEAAASIGKISEKH
jgi:hypothetical protein